MPLPPVQRRRAMGREEAACRLKRRLLSVVWIGEEPNARPTPRVGKRFRKFWNVFCISVMMSFIERENSTKKVILF